MTRLNDNAAHEPFWSIRSALIGGVVLGITLAIIGLLVPAVEAQVRYYGNQTAEGASGTRHPYSNPGGLYAPPPGAPGSPSRAYAQPHPYGGLRDGRVHHEPWASDRGYPRHPDDGAVGEGPPVVYPGVEGYSW